jgi:hypothetical protein
MISKTLGSKQKIKRKEICLDLPTRSLEGPDLLVKIKVQTM